ncbi:hypothetical protein GGS23DRAFT_182198 [Durotheca rogersii]|uniref:uncharacterized protein n=1 Tax=Durotheca rogersii TaxID=419775 RepID=UPI00221F866D|nr:uncharacterized protein GGS23DRAFT_182198 [Durotheca rogersii]KAI5867547.1 hypothetical protein GGS23DRAFT_182198 [Durotheca rogersii]
MARRGRIAWVAWIDLTPLSAASGKLAGLAPTQISSLNNDEKDPRHTATCVQTAGRPYIRVNLPTASIPACDTHCRCVCRVATYIARRIRSFRIRIAESPARARNAQEYQPPFGRAADQHKTTLRDHHCGTRVVGAAPRCPGI